MEEVLPTNNNHYAGMKPQEGYTHLDEHGRQQQPLNKNSQPSDINSSFQNSYPHEEHHMNSHPPSYEGINEFDQQHYTNQSLYNGADPYTINYQNINQNHSQAHNHTEHSAPTQEQYFQHESQSAYSSPPPYPSDYQSNNLQNNPQYSSKNPNVYTNVYSSQEVFPHHTTQQHNKAPHNAMHNQEVYEQHMQRGQKEKSPAISKMMSSNEKFVALALLAAIIVTAVIIGVGTSLFTPQQVTQDIQTQIALPVASPLADATNDSVDPNATPVVTPSNPTDELVIVYGTDTTPSTNTENTQPIKTAPVKATPVVKSTPVVSTPVAAANTPLTANNISTPVVTNTAPTIPAGAGTTQYWIQVFSTTNKDKALQIKSELITLGISPTIATKTINTNIYYRLRIGPYFNKAESNKFLNWIKSNPSYKDSYISVTKPQ